jgi:copper chaperone
MRTFHIPDMSCGHCIKAITAAVTQADGAAQVQVDLTQRQAKISSSILDVDAIEALLQNAGYSAALIADTHG